MKNEIKEIISDGFKSAFGGIIANEGIDHASGIIATALHKKGYRKQSETVKEFAEKLNRKAEVECDSDFNISIYNLEALAAEGKEEL